MFDFLPTIILRHRKENLQKCSLRGLEHREDLIFFSYPKDSLPSMEGYVVLTLDDAPLLSKEDQGLFLIDGTWKYAEKMAATTPQAVQHRSLPSHFKTAYPRKQTLCANPERGLATVEALYIAYHILGRNTYGLLDRYHWKDEFLRLNRDLHRNDEVEPIGFSRGANRDLHRNDEVEPIGFSRGLFAIS